MENHNINGSQDEILSSCNAVPPGHTEEESGNTQETAADKGIELDRQAAPPPEGDTKLCKYCQSRIPLKAKVCPYCRKKQSRKIIPVIAGIVVILVLIIGFSFGNSTNEQPSNAGLTLPPKSTATTSSQQNAPAAPSATPAPSPTPTPIPESYLVYLYRMFGENGSIPFQLNEKAKQFLSEREDQFPITAESGTVTVDSGAVDTEFDYREVLKNPAKFGDRLITLSGVYLNQIFESKILDDAYITELYVIDENKQVYYILYVGNALDGFLKGDFLTVYGLPLGTSFYDNVSGGTTNVIVVAGSLITKLS